MTHPIVAAARSWLGTRFHHQGRVKINSSHRGGVDCLGLLVGIAQELNLQNAQGIYLALWDEKNYPHVPDSRYLINRLGALLTPVTADVIRPGDILLLNIQGQPQHLAIVSDYYPDLGMIHAYAPAHAVIEHALDDWWKQSIAYAFRI